MARSRVMIGNMSVCPTTSRMADSATFLMVFSWSRISNRKCSADLIVQRITRSRSMMLRSEVSIRLSSGMLRFCPPRSSANPIDMDRCWFTLTMVRVSMGLGR